MSNHTEKRYLNGGSLKRDNSVASGVYSIVCLGNGKEYIGSSINLKRRFKTHYSKLLKNKHVNRKLQNSFNKYGKNSFIFTVVEFVTDTDKLLEIEQKYLDQIADFKKSLNILKGARGGDICESSNNIRKQKLKEIASKEDRSGKNNNFYGRKHSQETKDLIGLKNSQYVRTKEIREKLSKASLGRKHTEKTKRIMSEKSKGGNNAMAIPITIKGIQYSCKKEAIEKLNLKNYYHLEKLLQLERLSERSTIK